MYHMGTRQRRPRFDPRPAYRLLEGWLTVIALDFQFFLQVVDLTIVSLLVKPLESALRINDVEFAAIAATPALLGMFAAYYLAGLLADRLNRSRLVTIGTAAWSVAAFATAYVTSPIAFSLMRLVTGLSIGFVLPPAFSMLSDVLPPSRRSAVFGVFNTGLALGKGLAVVVGGVLVSSTRSWQMCFFAISGIGVLGSVVALFTAEPPRYQVASSADTTLRSAFNGFLAYIERHRALWISVFFAFGLANMTFWAINAWAPALGARRYAASDAASIALLGIGIAAGSLVGAIVFGMAVRQVLERGRPVILPFFMAADALLISGAAAIIDLAPSWLVAVLGITVAAGCTQALNVLFQAIIQEGGPNRVRGQLVGLNAFVSGVPQIAAPTIVAALAQHVFTGTGAIGTALSLVCGASSFGAALLFVLAGRWYPAAVRELASVAQRS